MAREHSRTVLHLCCDERLLAAVGAAVAHFAERVGMEETARDLLTGALEDLCRQTLPLLNGNREGLELAIEDFDDRLQISLEHRGEAQPSIGVESFIAECARDSKQRVTGVHLMRTVDRVEYDARNKNVRTTLVKYLQWDKNGR